MVFYRENENASELFVVDGQQRLLTITILLCVLRDHLLTEKEDKLARGLQRIIERPDLDDKERYTLYSENPYPFLQEHIQKFGDPELEVSPGAEEQNISAAYDDLYDRVQKYLELKGSKKFIETVKFLRDRALSLQVIMIELETEDDAYLIFETLNTRGKDLQTSDLVKNHLTRHLRAKNADHDTVREKWKDIQNTIGQSNSEIDLNTFLVHHWISKYEYLPEKKIFKSLKAKIQKTTASSYLDDLYRECKIYREIFEPNYGNWSKEEYQLQRSLRALSVFRVRQLAPFMLALFSEYKQKHISLKNITSYVRLIENFHFKFTAVTSQRGAGGIALMYSKAARGLRAAKTDDAKRAVCKDLVDRFDSMQPELIEFQVGLSEVLYSSYYTRQRQLVRYILEQIDRYLDGDKAKDYDQMTIEHILPQVHKVAEETKASLGNLIFVPKDLNQSLKTKKFADKKVILSENGVKFDPILTKNNDWGEAEIQKRFEYICKIAYDKIWQL
jgi:uncharacterized protein with ParB-like and HNH nuclease domain